MMDTVLSMCSMSEHLYEADTPSQNRTAKHGVEKKHAYIAFWDLVRRRMDMAL